MGGDVIRGPWRVMPSCEFGESRVVYPQRARWLMALGGDGRFGSLVQFVPLLLALAFGADLEFRPR